MVTFYALLVALILSLTCSNLADWFWHGEAPAAGRSPFAFRSAPAASE
jgi:hypothetical protein